jgi:hypothetical protein
MTRGTFACALAIGLLAADVAPVDAIPPFARRYRVSCNLCHAPPPRLNAFGEQFAGNGFVFMHGEEPRDTIATGDTLLALPARLPLGMRLDAYMQALTTVAQDETRVDMQTPYAIKLFSSAPIAKNVSYYLYFFLSERGEIVGLEDAYVQFSDIAGTGAAVMAGQFQVSDPLFKRELRLEFEDYQVYRVRVGDTRADLTYDRGLMAVYSPWTGGDLAFQVLNGRGLTPAGDNRQFDRDPWKNVALRYSHEIGPLRVGAFGLLGTEETEGVENRFTVWGPDATLQLGSKVELNVQYLRRNDNDPFYGAPGAPIETVVEGGFAEVIWAPGSAGGRWFVTGLVNWLDSDDAVFTIRQGEPGPLSRYRTGAVGVSYLLRRNLRLLVETQYDADRERARLTTGFTAAF